MFNYQCNHGELTQVFEDSGTSVLDAAFAKIDSQTTVEGAFNALLDIFKDAAPADAPADTPAAHPLYDQLVAGDFNDFTHEKFADMCGRIVAEENIPWEDLHQPIVVYVQENEPYGGYNSNAFEGEPAAASAA